jgi:hypothetical protein
VVAAATFDNFKLDMKNLEILGLEEESSCFDKCVQANIIHSQSQPQEPMQNHDPYLIDALHPMASADPETNLPKACFIRQSQTLILTFPICYSLSV